ncbi:hypothetical protein GCM10023174_00990 [Chelativorans composti]|jgi:Hypoxia induced protein conserved region.|uniref:Twin transmembrane helix small protein n=1 Tax=Chelativorans composti TaxID=768533 RepID=A0ABW5DJ62_9HYPH
MPFRPIDVLLALLMAAVVIVLIRGLVNMMRGGPAEKSNRLMRWRIAFQALAVLVAVIALWIGTRGQG